MAERSVPYESFVRDKLALRPPSGIDGDPVLPESLFPHQRALTRWALKRGRAAIFADTGLGKSRMQLAWAAEVRRYTNMPVLILAPLAVANQTAAEGRQIGVQVQVCRSGADVDDRGINIINYDRLHLINPEIFGGVVLDECFAAGTEIDCADGVKKRIQDIRKGDRILNASGVDTVADTHRREVKYGIKVKSQGQHFIASPNHPIFTQRGWVGAQDLRAGDCALATGAAVSLVRRNLRAERQGAEGAAVLRDILLSEMADEHARAQGEGSQAGDVRQDSREAYGVEGIGQPGSRERVGADSISQPNVEPGDSGEDFTHIESHEARTFRAWGQWDWAHGAAGVHGECAWRRLDSGICFVTGPTGAGLSDELQDRLSQSRVARGDRVGWSIASLAQGCGREERRQAGFVRLDGIEILEPGHPELERLRDANGKLYFYDLGATRHPSFSVNGLLVHNSSIIKHHDAKSFRLLTDAFRNTPFRLPATATPAPNDWTELGTHAEFLGICTRAEMLAEFFTHDGGDTSVWRLKGHSRAQFWRWVVSWGALIRRPSDLGFDDALYNLPPLQVHEHLVEVDAPMNGMLFAAEAQTLTERRDARRASLEQRVAECVNFIYGEWAANDMEAGVRGSAEGSRGGEPGASRSDSVSLEPWIIWCDLNAEQDALERAFGNLAFSIRGADSIEDKESRIKGWLQGERPVIISKPSILGFGLNMQRAARMAFVGVTDSYEAYYQAVRRCWRFGQKREVHVHIFASKAEGSIIANLKRKEREAGQMADALGAETRDAVMQEVTGSHRETNEYNASRTVQVPAWMRSAA